MADLYANWAQLAAAKTLNVDYRLPVRYNRSIAASIAIHGGSIEPGTSEVASTVAAYCRHNYYSLEGIMSSGNSDLHITSTNYDEPIGTALVRSMDYCFSFHGMSDQSPGVAEAYIGGLDTVSRDAVMAALASAGFTVSVGNNELNGTSTANITNKTRLLAGVQIEMSNTLRASFFPGNSLTRANRETGLRTQTFLNFVDAITFAINSLGGGAAQTTNYQLNKAVPSDQMNDFETWINSSWDKLTDVPAPNSGAVLPSSGNYNVGDRFYLTTTKSIYILVTKDVNWGWYWRPVQDAISPWFTVPNTAMKIGGWSLNPTGSNPMQIALDNRGKCHWRGVIGISAGTFARASSIGLFGCPPVGIRPRQYGAFMLGHDTLAVNTTATSLQSYQGARIFIQNDPTQDCTVRGFGGTADFNRIHLTGVSYAVGNSIYFTP